MPGHDPARRADSALPAETAHAGAGPDSPFRKGPGRGCLDRPGRVPRLDGSGRRQITGALDPDRCIVMVTASATRSTMSLLYGPQGLARSLEDMSGTRCFTISRLEALAGARARAADRAANVQVVPPLGRNVTLADSRNDRYQAGCAIVTDVHPAADGRNIVVEIPKPAAK